MAAKKSTGIDMEQNYVTVTLCIEIHCSLSHRSSSSVHSMILPRGSTSDS